MRAKFNWPAAALLLGCVVFFALLAAYALQVAARVYPPRAGEDVGGSVQMADGEWRMDINSASEEELTQLPGIGDTLAMRIVEYRESEGPFADASELTEVSGIGEGKLTAIVNLITALEPDEETDLESGQSPGEE